MSEKQHHKPKGTGNKYVTKYRRTRNLVKKCNDIAKQFNLDIILVMRNKKNDLLREVFTNQEMTLDHLDIMLQNNEKRGTLKYKREYAAHILKEEVCG